MKARRALANVARSAALAAMATVIILSLQAGLELVFAVLRGMLAFLVVQWVLGAVLDLLQVAAFHSSRRPASSQEAPERQPSIEGN